MLDLKTIESYYHEQLRVYKRNILREYLQYKILEILFNSKSSNNVSFIGGTSLRIVHNINRFSEDLDFDNLAIEKGQKPGIYTMSYSFLAKQNRITDIFGQSLISKIRSC